MKKINVNLSNKYPVCIGKDLLKKEDIIRLCKKLANRAVIITDNNLIDLYAKPLLQKLKKSKITSHLIPLVANEKNKSRKTKEKIEDKMFQLGCGRDTCIIAIGGGITTDIAGFIAATYCRGVPVIYIPTSLLGMIDASIGGKTGVNTPYGKNLIGAFYQPKAVFSDITTLKTLPKVELKNGLAEAIKHALIKDPKLFNFLDKNKDNIIKNDPDALKNLVIRNSQIKKEIAQQDEEDFGIRQILNFGHTIGHSLETATNYKIRHGEAMAIGMAAESYISMRLGYLSEKSFDKISSLIKKYLPIKMTKKYSKAVAQKTLTLDKKAINKKPMLVLLKDIGKVYKPKTGYTTPAPTKLVNEALDYVSCKHCG